MKDYRGNISLTLPIEGDVGKGEYEVRNLLSTAPDYYRTQVWILIFPGLAILITTMAFNLLGDGLRDAFDPRSTI